MTPVDGLCAKCCLDNPLRGSGDRETAPDLRPGRVGVRAREYFAKLRGFRTCEAQDSSSGALNTRCWQSMVKDGAPHDLDARAAFEEEVLPHADRLFRLAMWFERNRADAEDVVQETMMHALRSFHRYQPGTNCRAWLTTILQHIVSNRRRAQGRSSRGGDPAD